MTESHAKEETVFTREPHSFVTNQSPAKKHSSKELNRLLVTAKSEQIHTEQNENNIQTTQHQKTYSEEHSMSHEVTENKSKKDPPTRSESPVFTTNPHSFVRPEIVQTLPRRQPVNAGQVPLQVVNSQTQKQRPPPSPRESRSPARSSSPAANGQNGRHIATQPKPTPQGNKDATVLPVNVVKQVVLKILRDKGMDPTEKELEEAIKDQGQIYLQ